MGSELRIPNAAAQTRMVSLLKCEKFLLQLIERCKGLSFMGAFPLKHFKGSQGGPRANNPQAKNTTDAGINSRAAAAREPRAAA